MDTLARRQIFLDQFVEFPIRYGGWAMSEDILFDIVQFCLLKEPKTILDLGSGASTVVLAKYAENAEKNGYKVNILTVDSDKDWLDDTMRILNKIGVKKYVKAIYAPIVESKYGPYYTPENITAHLTKDSIELLVIDGPVGVKGKQSRYPAMPILYPYFAQDVAVILDDGARPDESKIAQRWMTEFEDLQSEYRPYEKGMYIFYKKNSRIDRYLISNHSGQSLEHTSQALEEARQLIDSERQLKESERQIYFQKVEVLNSKIIALEALAQKNTSILDKKTQQVKKLRSSHSFTIGNYIVRSIKFFGAPIRFLNSLVEKRN